VFTAKQGSTVRRSFAAVAAAALLTAGLTACSSGAADDATSSSSAGSTADGTVITLSQLMFMPATTTIKVGTKVTWTNDESISHTVTSGEPTGVDKGTSLRSGEKRDGMFDEQLAKKGDSFSFTFDKAGTYPYYCDIHQGMNAEVVVTP
jgi:plastocyanin